MGHPAVYRFSSFQDHPGNRCAGDGFCGGLFSFRAAIYHHEASVKFLKILYNMCAGSGPAYSPVIAFTRSCRSVLQRGRQQQQEKPFWFLHWLWGCNAVVRCGKCISIQSPMAELCHRSLMSNLLRSFLGHILGNHKIPVCLHHSSV